ncbi:MAG: histidine kinase [Proteobacteria bacterium]|nr:MAG: histidine kinase [Pseudomonadota bacterium]
MRLPLLMAHKTNQMIKDLLEAVVPQGDKARDLAPFASLLIVVSFLFMCVFCKMEVRRMGYSVLKLGREERNMRDLERQQLIALAKITRPDRLQSVAQNRLRLEKAEAGQIIQMTERGVALKQ